MKTRGQGASYKGAEDNRMGTKDRERGTGGPGPQPGPAMKTEDNRGRTMRQWGIGFR